MNFDSMKQKLRAQVGMRSCVGFYYKSGPPYSSGNYFSLADKYSTRVVNMWAENLKAAGQFLQDGLIECIVIEKEMSRGEHTWLQRWAIVTDPRLPKGFTFDYPYFCGCYSIPKDILIKLGEYMGWDPEGRMLEYTDPERYHSQRGGTYNPKTGVVSYNLKPKSSKLKEGWTIEVKQDASNVSGLKEGEL